MEWTFNGLEWTTRQKDFPAFPSYDDYDRRLGWMVDSKVLKSWIQCLEEGKDPSGISGVVHRPFTQRLRKVVLPFAKHFLNTALCRTRFIYWSAQDGKATWFCRTERWRRPVGAQQSMSIWKCKKILNKSGEGDTQ